MDMKARRANNKSKTWFSICREKPQTIDSDSSDREIEEVDNGAENKVTKSKDKVQDGVENKGESRQRDTPILSKISTFFINIPNGDS